MIPVDLPEWAEKALTPYCARGVVGMAKFTPRELADAIDALPDTAGEKGLIVHYWQRLLDALDHGNAEAVDAWLTLLALARHTAGFLIPLATGKIKQEKTIKRVRSAGTATTKAKAYKKMEVLEQAVMAHPTWKPKQFGSMADELDLSEAVIIKKVQAIRKKTKNG